MKSPQRFITGSVFLETDIPDFLIRGILRQLMIIISIASLISCSKPEKVLYTEHSQEEFTARIEKCPVTYLHRHKAIQRLGVTGKDRRIYASKEFGKSIVDFEIKKMIALIAEELSKLKLNWLNDEKYILQLEINSFSLVSVACITSGSIC